MSIRRVFTSRVADPLFWGVVKRYPLFERLAEFRRRQWDDAATLRRRQDEALGALLAHALERVPYYAEKVPGLSPDDAGRDPRAALAAFPVLGKNDLFHHSDSLVCEMGRGTYASSSGGSTGEPVRFLHDRIYQSAALATTILFFEWTGVGHGERHVKLWGAPRDIGGHGVPARRRIADWLANRTTLDAFDMSDEAMGQHARMIGRLEPACLEGYADALYELALHMERTRTGPVRPRVVVSSAGTLFPHMREKITEVFGSPVFDRYGTREVGNVAAECEEHRGLHVFGETTVLEIVDDSGRPVPERVEGDVLITNLTNFTMPFIRYRVGDRAVWGSGPCGCGRQYPLLARIAGRAESRVVRPDGGFVPAEFFIHILGVEYNDGSVRRFQVVQTSPEEIVIRVVPTESGGSKAPTRRDEIARRIRQMVGGNCRVRFQVEERIEPTPTGKHMHVIGLAERREAD